MAEEAVIFPDQPLFMVDRGWQRRKKRAGKDLPRAEYERELQLQPARVPEVTITVAKAPSSAGSTSQSTKENGLKPAKGTAAQPVHTQFMNYEPSLPKKKQQHGKKERALPRTSSAGVQLCNDTTMGPRGTPQGSLTLKQSLAGTSTALFSVLDPEVSSFQGRTPADNLRDPTQLASSMYPITKAVALTHNPVETFWFPAIVRDEVSLHAMLFSCAMHYFLGSGQLTFRDSDLLMKAILSRLNRRLHEEKYSDLTIGAVSCLALCENQLGNHPKWKMHAAGMSEMVRARGGFQTVQDVLHMKIYRADTIGAADTLTHPNFPRPARTSESLFAILAIEPPPTPIKELLVDLGLTQTVLNVLVELSHLCHALNQAAETRILVDPTAFDEDITCIQHDLLRSISPEQEGAERLCVITALIFIQTLTREVPFTRLCSSHISKQLKEALPTLDASKAPARLIYWMLFMGGLVSKDTNENVWFRKRLRELHQLRDDLLEWESVKAQLQKVFWVGAMQESFGLELWHDIGPSRQTASQ
ncbi:hypothetical protein A1O7_06624 [Cladophialophora yegresii CBS 114405]|uniref:Transcription factor domain-containing protein n=1 Tax=Cladophialophora yegresii CBS 114405 TaxID=1182544 RepID=W9VTW7_9EURO|nr:uncharacterized protein A1O7_06624 [Cladophialophora yegresii CBS 114405]EXJ59192.1 hypothetical protein A1O7_06624 [Cladophialophora yegresii CBS 114405]